MGKRVSGLGVAAYSRNWRSGTLKRWHFASLTIDDWIVELDGEHGVVYLNPLHFPHPFSCI